jgi:hypothetical protein
MALFSMNEIKELKVGFMPLLPACMHELRHCSPALGTNGFSALRLTRIYTIKFPVHIYVYICVYVCVFVCIYIYIYECMYALYGLFEVLVFELMALHLLGRHSTP